MHEGDCALIPPGATHKLFNAGQEPLRIVCACAPAMGQIIAGRFVQGGGGGLLSAVAYVVVRGTFPENLWPRVFALLAGAWSISVLVGPLVGGFVGGHFGMPTVFLATCLLMAAGACWNWWVYPTRRDG